MKLISFMVVLSMALFLGCKEESSQPASPSSKLAIYNLSDTSITAAQAWDMPLNTLSLASTPFATERDIVSYNWTTHSFTLQPLLEPVIANLKTKPGKSAGVPFVITVNNERIYLGAFWWSYSSMIPQVPYIDVMFPSPYQIKFDSTSSHPDSRGDQRIHDALKAAGILVE